MPKLARSILLSGLAFPALLAAQTPPASPGRLSDVAKEAEEEVEENWKKAQEEMRNKQGGGVRGGTGTGGGNASRGGGRASSGGSGPERTSTIGDAGDEPSEDNRQPGAAGRTGSDAADAKQLMKDYEKALARNDRDEAARLMTQMMNMDAQDMAAAEKDYGDRLSAEAVAKAKSCSRCLIGGTGGSTGRGTGKKRGSVVFDVKQPEPKPVQTAAQRATEEVSLSPPELPRLTPQELKEAERLIDIAMEDIPDHVLSPPRGTVHDGRLTSFGRELRDKGLEIERQRSAQAAVEDDLLAPPKYTKAASKKGTNKKDRDRAIFTKNIDDMEAERKAKAREDRKIFRDNADGVARDAQKREEDRRIFSDNIDKAVADSGNAGEPD